MGGRGYFRRNEEEDRVLVRQFDSVGVLPVALVLFRQDFFEPPCLLFGNPLIHGLRLVADDELLAAAVAPECSHLLEPCGFLAAALLYCYRSHILILVGNSLDSYIGSFRIMGVARVMPQFLLSGGGGNPQIGECFSGRTYSRRVFNCAIVSINRFMRRLIIV